MEGLLLRLEANREKVDLCLPGFTGPGWQDFQLGLVSFEAAYQDAQAAFCRSLETDTLAERQPEDDPRPIPLLLLREGKQGGAHLRPPPPVEELVAAAEGGSARRRIHGGLPNASFEQLAERLHRVYHRRGRGLSEADATVQLEFTKARSLGIGYFISKGERGDRIGVPPAVRTHLGRPGACRWELIAWIIEAKRLGYAGLYVSASEFARTTGISERTFWRTVQFAEKKGFITVLRTYKDGQGDRPVGLSRNWYGPGPALRKLAAAYMPKKSGLFDSDRAHQLVEEWKGDVRRRIARKRRGRARELGFPSRFEFARELVEADEDFARRLAHYQQQEDKLDGGAQEVAERILAGEDLSDWEEVLAILNRRRGELGEIGEIGAPPVLHVPRSAIETARVLLTKDARKLGAWLHEGLGVVYDRAAAFSGELVKHDGDECPGGSLPFAGEPGHEEMGATFVAPILDVRRERSELEGDPEITQPDPDLDTIIQRMLNGTERVEKSDEQRDHAEDAPDFDEEIEHSECADEEFEARTSVGELPPMTQRHGTPVTGGTSSGLGNSLSSPASVFGSDQKLMLCQLTTAQGHGESFGSPDASTPTQNPPLPDFPDEDSQLLRWLSPALAREVAHQLASYRTKHQDCQDPESG